METFEKEIFLTFEMIKEDVIGKPDGNLTSGWWNCVYETVQRDYAKEKIYKQIEEELDFEKKYMIVEVAKTNEQDEKAVLTMAVFTGSAIGLAIADNNFALLKLLIESGAHIELDEILVIEIYEDNMLKTYNEVMLMEVLGNFNHFTDEEYAWLWKRVKESSTWPLQQPFKLQLPVSEKMDTEIICERVRRLDQQWAEASDVLLEAFVEYYFKRMKELKEDVWMDLCSKLNDKTNIIFRAALGTAIQKVLAIYYPEKSDEMKIFSLLWHEFQKNERVR